MKIFSKSLIGSSVLTLMMASTTVFATSVSEDKIYAGAKLPSVSMVGYDFTKYKDLSGIKFTKANLTRANFSGVDLTGATFYGAKLGRANFKGAILNGVNFKKAKMGGCNLESTEAIDVDFSDADLSGAKMMNANLTDSTIDNVSLRGAKMMNVNLTGVKLRRVDKSGTRFDGATWIDGTTCGDRSIGKCSEYTPPAQPQSN